MQRIRIPVEIRAENGQRGGIGEVEFARPPFARRLWKAGVLFLVGLVGGALLLPVPLIHLFGIMFFLALTGLAIKRLLSRQVFKGASGTCPACHAEGTYFIGFGGRRLAWPVKTSCPHCSLGLELWPLAQGAQG